MELEAESDALDEEVKKLKRKMELHEEVSENVKKRLKTLLSENDNMSLSDENMNLGKCSSFKIPSNNSTQIDTMKDTQASIKTEQSFASEDLGNEKIWMTKKLRKFKAHTTRF